MAGQLIEESTRVRAEARAVVDERRRRVNWAKALDQADRESIVAGRLAQDRHKRVAKAVLRKLQRSEVATRRELRHTLDSTLRADLDPVLEAMCEQGTLAMTAGSSLSSDEFRLPDGLA